VLIITTGGYGKRVPVSASQSGNEGKIATKFKSRKFQDKLAALRIVNEDDELMMVTSRGIIIRQAVRRFLLNRGQQPGYECSVWMMMRSRLWP